MRVHGACASFMAEACEVYVRKECGLACNLRKHVVACVTMSGNKVIDVWRDIHFCFGVVGFGIFGFFGV